MLSEPYILFGLWLHLLQHRCYQVARLIWVSIKGAHSRVIKLVNWRSCSCNSVAIELIVDLFMWHHHKWTSACFCMPSACSMQSIFDLVHALLCNWTVNLWMFLVQHRRNRNVWWLVLALISAGLLVITMCWSNNNWWLRSCSHNYQCMYCWDIIAITKWSIGFQP